ncbi:hypothetical protein [Halomonas sp. QHL1]|uniref:hypothetical protein n=1 Tax=Halomonas sp. QHL1 TaxID=1123773 RepID=UPI001587AEBE|nr:hypothetical protein [Halomonas sp. QHL1]
MSAKNLWGALSYLENKRDPAYDFIVKNKKNIINIELRCLIRMRELLSSPSPASAEELNEFIVFYKLRKGSLKIESEFRRLLIALIAKKLTSTEAYEAFARAGLMDKITIHQVLKILHKASIEKQCSIFYSLKEQYSKEMNPAAIVKVNFWESRISDYVELRYEDIEENFCQLKKSLSKEYGIHLRPLFNAIPENKNILDFQVNENKYLKIKSELRKAIIKRECYSFVRLNDGEGYGFPNNALPCAFDMERQELHWWGEALPSALREKIQKDFRLSLSQHDLVGIPSVFRFIDELSINRDYSIFNNALLCRLFTLCHGYLKAYDGKAYITEGQINLYLFDRDYIARLSGLAQRVVFISGAKKEYLQRVFSELQHATYIELPTHRLLKQEKFSYSEAAKPLPYVYEDYIEQIKGLAGPGVVFFISAGFIGKIFAAEVAKNGGVALDVGQSLMNIVANHDDA